MRTRYLFAIGVLALALALGTLTPAFGGPSSSDRSTAAKEAAAARKLAGKALQKANKALRAARAPGPTGQAGPAGEPGPAGSSLAYAKVSASGEVDAAFSKGVAAGAVTTPQEGIYCFDLNFTPKNVEATLTDISSGEIDAALPPSVGPTCGANDSAEVLTKTSAGLSAGSNRAFFVLFN